MWKQRIIRCGGTVDDDMANLIVAQLLYLDAADPNRVCLVSQALRFMEMVLRFIAWSIMLHICWGSFASRVWYYLCSGVRFHIQVKGLVLSVLISLKVQSLFPLSALSSSYEYKACSIVLQRLLGYFWRTLIFNFCRTLSCTSIPLGVQLLQCFEEM